MRVTGGLPALNRKGVRMSDLIPTALLFLADRLESERHPFADLARAVAVQAGPPTPAGAQALYDLQVELGWLDGWQG